MSTSEDLTPDQKKQISKILFNSRLSLVGLSAKFSVGLFLSNLLVFLINFYCLKDTDPEMQQGFVYLSVFLNFIFMIWYLHDRANKLNQKVQEKVKEVLKK